MKSGFGSKGYTKSSTQTSGVKTYAQNFGSIRSAFLSIIPYTDKLKIWTTLNPKTITLTTSGSTSVINRWNDIIQNSGSTQSSTASMPTLDTTYGIGKYNGIRFISDDFLSPENDATRTAYMTYGAHFISNTNRNTASYYIMANHNMQSELFYAFNFYQEGLGANRFARPFMASFWLFSMGNRGYGAIQPFTGKDSYNFPEGKFFQNDYIHYMSMGVTSNRELNIILYGKEGETIFNGSLGYVSSLGTDNTGSWDTMFGVPASASLPVARLRMGRSAADSVYYNFIQFGSSGPPTAQVLQNITRYLESAYGKVMNS